MIRSLVFAAVLAGAAAWSLSAAANPLSELKGALPGLSGGEAGAGGALSGGSLLGALGGGGFSLASPQNVAGVLSYCQSNGYLPSASETVKDKLMSKLGLQSDTQQSSDYKEGAAGLLKDAQGGTFNLAQLKDTIGKQACGMVADKASSSLLGGL